MGTLGHRQTNWGAGDIVPEYYRVPQAVRVSGIRRSSLYKLIGSGAIASKLVKTNKHNVGGLRLVSAESLRAFIEGCASK